MCKEGCTQKEADDDTVKAEEDCNDEINSNTVPEISEAFIPEEKVQSVKVIFMFSKGSGF